MAAIDDLISQIDNPELRDKIQQELRKVTENIKFGLKFERHLPERTPLYGIPVKKGATVAKYGDMNTLYKVLNIEDDIALCMGKNVDVTEKIAVDGLVTVAEFGEPIYPYLEPLDSVENAPDSGLWHTLIEADNYHALQLLDYLYHGKVDCIYIDPPYNTGAKDWKYNNDYVDGNDSYRHSKWLSMMEKRLLLAKKLLKKDGVLITTIDDNEYATLYMLIQRIFSECFNNTISIQMNPGGTQGKAFSVTNEYAIVTYFKDSEICRKRHIGGDTYNLRRWGSTSNRYEGATCFYPIILDANNNIIGFGDVLPDDKHPLSQVEINPDGSRMVWPIDIKGNEKKWRYARDTVESVKNRMFIESKKDRIEILLRRETEPPKTIWNEPEYNAESNGTKLIKSIIGKGKFSYPKSLYATKDCIALSVANKPDALILDFFAGSGTTLHAVNLLNAEDGGNRRCIIVTNNEVSENEAKSLIKKGHKPGDDEWNKLGIARYVTWPRTVCSIEGHDINGQPLKGNYIGSDRPMADGFPTNANFFKLGFLDKMAVRLGTQLEKLIPVLWMKANAVGKCPSISDDRDYYIFPENRFAILVNESKFNEFKDKIADKDLDVVYLVTDYEPGYIRMRQELGIPTAYQLYRDYLDNFRINQR